MAMPKPLLKPYCQSVLRIRVPLVVTLAQQSMRIDQVTQLEPGVLIQFDKPCDSPMTIEVGGQAIAQGEVVKTGDKFGIRIGSILKPAERFMKIS
ncbi:MAG: FliM/FliN family flagellar motor switch protein [Planctomycetales bacterium]|nr:FliM/FliN family flagellar motor switch protein [Planctomycetales bacterium]